MKSSNKLKIFNDPIYGFITIPNSLIFDLIQHKYFQRLRRITQMGLSYLVYPGAHHTRFHHALGSMHLMQKAINVLRFKEVNISEDEENGLLIAILLHDIGHGPFSHAMEHSLVNDVSHEEISLRFMEELNQEFNGSLTLAISIFKGEYPRKFMCELISSQLDMDRADYLKRDSFYTGVAEGNINSERLITMLNVVDDHLVVEEKGIYSVEKFLVARRFMYWQVYLHKTGVVAEQLLTRTLKRAKELVQSGVALECSESLFYFLNSEINAESFNTDTLNIFAQLDDYDIVAAMKQWQYHDDFVLSNIPEEYRQYIDTTARDEIGQETSEASSSTQDKAPKEIVTSFRKTEDATNLLLFIHGFSGESSDTFGRIPELLMADAKMDGWDMMPLGYSQYVKPELGKDIWAAIEDVNKIADYLVTSLKYKFDKYDRIAIIGHSLGGLVAQPSTTPATSWKLTIPFSHDPKTSLTLSLVHQSDYSLWLYKELDARRREEVSGFVWKAPFKRTIKKTTNDDDNQKKNGRK